MLNRIFRLRTIVPLLFVALTSLSLGWAADENVADSLKIDTSLQAGRQRRISQLIVDTPSAIRESAKSYSLGGDWKWAPVDDTDAGEWGRLTVPGWIDAEEVVSLRKRFWIEPGDNHAWQLTLRRFDAPVTVIVNDNVIGECVAPVAGTLDIPRNALREGANKLELIIDLEPNSEHSITRSNTFLDPQLERGWIEDVTLIASERDQRGVTVLEHSKQVGTRGKAIIVNGVAQELRGVTYVPRHRTRFNVLHDLDSMRALGANTIRLIDYPSEEFLRLTDSLGLFVFAELPIRHTPGKLLPEDLKNVSAIARSFALIAEHSSVIAIGLGEGYDGSDESRHFVETLASSVRSVIQPSDCLLYATNIGQGLDLDIDAMTLSPDADVKPALGRVKSLTKPVILFASGPWIQPGDHSGYSNDISEEAQAKYVADLIHQGKAADIAGLFFTFRNYERAAPSSLGGTSAGDGLRGIDDRPRLAYEIVRANWTGLIEPSLDAGAEISETSSAFVVYGIALLLIFFLLVNVDRRFREYVKRSLMRPYNFFADVRDQRLIPNAQTTLLAIVIAGSLTLLLGGLFFRFRNEYLANWLIPILLPFKSVRSAVYSIAWEPISLLIFGSLVFLGAVVSLALLIRFAAIFVRGRIFLSDTYNVTVWALLPLIFIIPYGMIVGRLDADSATVTTAFTLLALILLWVLYRLMKGIGVLFDVYPTRIYLYGTIGLLVLGTAILLHFNYHYSTFAQWAYFREIARAASAH